MFLTWLLFFFSLHLAIKLLFIMIFLWYLQSLWNYDWRYSHGYNRSARYLFNILKFELWTVYWTLRMVCSFIKVGKRDVLFGQIHFSYSSTYGLTAVSQVLSTRQAFHLTQLTFMITCVNINELTGFCPSQLLLCFVCLAFQFSFLYFTFQATAAISHKW